MHIVNINDTVQVRIQPLAKKNKTNPSLYDLYLRFTITESGIATVTPPELSLGIKCETAAWDNPNGKMIGKSERAILINATISRHLNTVLRDLETLARNNHIQTCTQVRQRILNETKIKLTGKAPRGRKKEIETIVKQKTIDAVLNDLFETKKQSPERQRIYRHAINILEQYYKGDVPLIHHITKKDLTKFKIWYRDNYRTYKGTPPAQDSTATWFNMIASVFIHAYKRMEIIPSCPLPEGFRTAWKEHEKTVLTEKECLELINLNDNKLSVELKISKYCLIIQMLTGIGYGDMLALSREHLKFDTTLQKWYIKKERNKTQKSFKIYLSSRAKASIDKLRQLSPSDDLLFTLPTSLNGINKNYKALAKRAGVPKQITTYMLRHTFAVNYMDNDGRLEDLSKMLGNDINNTKKYGKISDKRLAEKAVQLEQKSKMHQLNF